MICNHIFFFFYQINLDNLCSSFRCPVLLKEHQILYVVLNVAYCRNTNEELFDWIVQLCAINLCNSY